MGLIIAVLLALAAGIVAISAPHAAASADGRTVAATLTAHDRAGHDHAAHSHASTAEAERASAQVHAASHPAAAEEDCSEPASAAHGKAGTECCGTGACHAVQMLVSPKLHTPLVSAVLMTVVRDDQVGSIVVAGLDRPPRTV